MGQIVVSRLPEMRGFRENPGLMLIDESDAELRALEKEKTDLEYRMGDLEEEIGQLKAEMEDLEEQHEDLQLEIDDFESDVPEFFGCTECCWKTFGITEGEVWRAEVHAARSGVG